MEIKKNIKYLFDFFRLSLIEFMAISVLFFMLFLGSNFKSIMENYDNKHVLAETRLSEEVKNNVELKYIEDILFEYKGGLNKTKSVQGSDLYGFKKEIEGLIPNGVIIDSFTVDESIITISGKAPNLRVVDLVMSIFETYKKYYKGLDSIELKSVNSDKKNGIVSFSIGGKINKKGLVDKIYTDDIDGDGVKDYENKEVITTTGIKQYTKVLNDQCPFTKSSNIIIGKLLKNNKEIINIYPYYKNLYNKGYFDFNEETGCLVNGDIKLDF